MQLSDLIPKIENHKQSIMDAPRRSAVLMPFVETPEGLSLLFEVRAANISDPGEVCFPGGRIESGEMPQETAVRETCEELGVDPSAIRILGENDLLVAYGGRVVHSFFGVLNTEDLHISKTEVREVFTIPLQWLADHEPEDHSIPLMPCEPEGFDASVFGVTHPYPWKKGVYELPLWKYKEYYLWGLSARMVQSLLRIINEENR